MYELQWLAFRSDMTRVVTFMLGRELNFRTYPEIGITEGHHGLSHHQDNPTQLAKYARLNTYQTELFAWFLEKLQSTPEGDGTLLDHSMFLYGASLSNPNLHAHYDLPLAVVGGGAGQLRGGRHLVFRSETPMTNLLLSLLDKAGVPAEKLGDSTGAAGAACQAYEHGSLETTPNSQAPRTPNVGEFGFSWALGVCAGAASRRLAQRLVADVTLVDAVKRGDAAAVRALLQGEGRRQQRRGRRHDRSSLGRAARGSRDRGSAAAKPAPKPAPQTGTESPRCISPASTAIPRW